MELKIVKDKFGGENTTKLTLNSYNVTFNINFTIYHVI